ncbi:hypothetical protein [Bradyrhizobium sp. BWA-3-5]|uniref:hypothetical protein n=1 Tax=Bradyrhizobium sp. BWA-3-5 TaxID=3080013 RepID=UPI00293F3C3A|nr:hypothetical protein [Bradyrhizobium sp. BWA-3-5]WOH64111.1 hypothetical protein RX331_26375 [Bradyrhizobium sp. BWA-3-5]WOH64228.1 hypothetical protein RX331_27115 [Bradyrhizobium sp. BWA-3-5]
MQSHMWTAPLFCFEQKQTRKSLDISDVGFGTTVHLAARKRYLLTNVLILALRPGGTLVAKPLA